jgi:hypothetical protein
MDQRCDGFLFLGTLLSRDLLFFRRNPDPFRKTFLPFREGNGSSQIIRYSISAETAAEEYPGRKRKNLWRFDLYS